MGNSKIPSKLILVDVSAKNDTNANSMVISGKVHLSSSISSAFDHQNMCLKLLVEGKEKEIVHRVFASGIEKSFHVLFHGRNSISKSHEGIFVKKEYEIPENPTNDEGGNNNIFFTVSLGNESLSWKPTTKRKVQHSHGPYRREGEFEVSYTVKAYVTIKPSDIEVSDSVYHWSNAARLQFAPTAVDKTTVQQQDKFRIEVGAPAMIPQTKLCGLLEGSSTQYLSLVPSQNKIQLTPNQQLTILLVYETQDMQDHAHHQAGGLLLDLEKVHVKFSQRTVCLGESFDRHWERKLASSTTKTIDEEESSSHILKQGTVEVPGWWTPSYNGAIIQILNEMTVYITKDGKQSKDMIAATPKIIVQVRR